MQGVEVFCALATFLVGKTLNEASQGISLCLS